MKRLCLMLGCLLLGLLPAGSTLAAGAVFFGDDESYGWCSGYTSREAARKCALEQCKGAEGVNCQLALECQGGWGAVATGDNGGYGIACEASMEVNARIQAQLACTFAVKGLCHTQTTFSERNQSISQEDNALFDRTIFAQVLLLKLGYYKGRIDAHAGSDTKSALKSFQSQAGLPVTSEPDEKTLDQLTAKLGGAGALVAAILEGNRDVDTSDWHIKTAAPRAEAVQPSTSQNIPTSPLDAFGVNEEALNGALSEGIGNINGQTGNNFSFQGTFTCGRLAGDSKIRCTATVTDPASPEADIVDLYHVDGSDVFAQMEAMADKRSREEGGADHLDRKSQATFTTKNGEKRVVDFGCVQHFGDRVSHGICYIEVTKSIGLMTTVAPPSPNRDPGGVKTTDEGTAEMQRAFDLLGGMSLALLDVTLKK
ncbi:DUF4189 domain-containing protein [Mesorhizobium sp. B2-4-17]|nr:DUF4189 domain-containing protein [Mesorhizobium sp. B2-4-17]